MLRAPAAGMATLKYNRDNLVSLLAERATFERSAVTLYDALLESIQDFDHQILRSSMDALRLHRDEEEEHALWVEGLLDKLGGFPQHELADAVAGQSRLLVDMIRNARASGSVLAMFYAMLSSELMDGEGWKLLLEVADELDDADAVVELKSRVAREDEHLALIREIVFELARESVMFAEDAEIMDEGTVNVDVISAAMTDTYGGADAVRSGVRRGLRAQRQRVGRGAVENRGATRTRRA